MPDIWFWQSEVTPHMIGLAIELNKLSVNVTYIAETFVSTQRKEQGWLEPSSGSVRIQIAGEQSDIHKLVADVPKDSIHICQGIRRNGLVGAAQKHLAVRGITQWVAMETVRDVGYRGVLQRLEYGRLFRKNRNAISGVLAIGYQTPHWVIQRGVPEDDVYPFAYFLEESESLKVIEEREGPFRFIFVGQFIPRKGLEWLLLALGELAGQNFELVVIGSGLLENELRTKAERVLGNRLHWFGKLPANEVGDHMAAADCLILPSVHDGWGAVVSEALMRGTPVICSDSCGSAGVVDISGVGGVFRTGDIVELKASLQAALDAGHVSKSQRRNTIAWSEALGAKAGAQYLLNILRASLGEGERPQPPWTIEQFYLA